MAAKKKSKKSTSSFPTEVAARVSPALMKAFEAARAKHDGLFAHGMPFRSVADRFQVHFDAHAAYDVMCTAGEDLPQTQTLVPLAVAGDDDECFAVDGTKPEFPVFYFEHEAGYHAFKPSLDAFLASLLKKGEKTPLAMLDKTAEKANTLHEKKKYKEVIALLVPALVGIERVRRGGDSVAASLPHALNLLGMAYTEVGALDDAVTTLREAAALGEDRATLNLCDLYADKLKDHRQAVATARALAVQTWRGTYEWFWARNYIGQGSLRLGDRHAALRAYHEIHADCLFDHLDFIAKAIEGLEALAREGGAAGQAASGILAWFGRLPEVPAARAAELITWWKSLPPSVTLKLSASAKFDQKAPTALDLTRLLEAASLKLDQCELTDLSFVRPFRALRVLNVEGNQLTDFSTLPPLPHLTTLRANANPSLVSLKGVERAPHLETLSVRKSGLKHLRGVEPLKRLTELDFASCEVTDLEPLRGLRELTKLSFYSNDVRDLSPLAGCTKLRAITCFGNDQLTKGLLALASLPELEEVSTDGLDPAEVEAFSAARAVKVKPQYAETTDADRQWWRSLAEYPELREALRASLDADEDLDGQLGKLVAEDHFSLAEVGLRSISPLARCAGMRFIDVSRNPLADVSPLAKLTRLENLRASGTPLTSVAPLRELSRLVELDATASALTSLEGVEGLTSLHELWVSDTQVLTLEPVRAIASLRDVRFAQTKVSTLEPLASQQELVHVDCSNTRVTDLSPLATCASLQRIDCYDLPGVSGLRHLAKLEHLAFVYSHGCLSAAELAEFRAMRPEVFVD